MILYILGIKGEIMPIISPFYFQLKYTGKP